MILRKDVQAMMAAGCKNLMPRNGAWDAARIIDSLATDMKLGHRPSASQARANAPALLPIAASVAAA
jgi:hypothetical protein